METNQIDVLAATVLRDFKKIKNAKKAGSLSESGGDIRKTYSLYRIDLDLAQVVHTIATANLDVWTQPEPDAAGDFPTTNSVAQAFREYHGGKFTLFTNPSQDLR